MPGCRRLPHFIYECPTNLADEFIMNASEIADRSCPDWSSAAAFRKLIEPADGKIEVQYLVPGGNFDVLLVDARRTSL
jgi:hypothetical protein